MDVGFLAVLACLGVARWALTTCIVRRLGSTCSANDSIAS
jgi:hypothetical protein